MIETYANDVQFLRERADVIELTGEGGARLAVMPQYQGRVMTSTLAGPEGSSFGWVNRRFIQAGGESRKFNNYGGEDRFWIGPEAGQFGLWFQGGDPFDVEHWFTPPAFNRGTFRVTSQGETSVAMASEFTLQNYSGTSFSCAVGRVIRSLSPSQASEALGATIPGGLAMVGFESKNTLVNAGERPWTPDKGLLSIWVLGQFRPLARGSVIIPFVPGEASALGPQATTNYFGEPPPQRCRVTDDHLLLACDGEYRSKVGISRRRARNVLGSFDPDANVLTLVAFNLPSDAAQRPYVNSLWTLQDRPFDGDVVNSYNEGPDYPGVPKPQHFYELETSSPAAELAAGGAITHLHRTFHFHGPFDALRELGRQTLGMDLTDSLIERTTHDRV